MKYKLYKNIGDIDIYTEFEMLEFEVPIIFLGTVSFLPLREGRYCSCAFKRNYVNSSSIRTPI